MSRAATAKSILLVKRGASFPMRSSRAISIMLSSGAASARTGSTCKPAAPAWKKKRRASRGGVVMQISAVDLSEYIERKYFQQRPHVRARRIPVAVIAEAAYESGWSVPVIMQEYGLSETEVLAALLYYVEHRESIDALEAAYRDIPIEKWIEHGDDAVLFRRDDAAQCGE
ncbi:MAG: hypothetical protein CUN53_02290 [Phototrophicales bacterium]|nr:MAG: hypothetical protein CUN53_02290 [Phototrophicales bacterium]